MEALNTPWDAKKADVDLRNVVSFVAGAANKGHTPGVYYDAIKRVVIGKDENQKRTLPEDQIVPFFSFLLLTNDNLSTDVSSQVLLACKNYLRNGWKKRFVQTPDVKASLMSLIDKYTEARLVFCEARVTDAEARLAELEGEVRTDKLQKSENRGWPKLRLARAHQQDQEHGGTREPVHGAQGGCRHGGHHGGGSGSAFAGVRSCL